MTISENNEKAPWKPLRLWPGVVAVVLQWLIRFGVPLVVPENAAYGVLGGIVGGLAVVLWWLFFSRAPWSERIGAIVLMIVALFATSRIVDKSIATGMMGMMLYISAIPILCLALVAWALASRRLSSGYRRATLIAAILLACGVFPLLRTDGITGNGNSDIHWRWEPTAEERLLAQAGNERTVLLSAPAAAETPAKRLPVPTSHEPTIPTSAPAVTKTPARRFSDHPGHGPTAPTSTPAATETRATRVLAHTDRHPTELSAAPAVAKTYAEWPGFRGLERNSVIHGVRIETDWSKSPPVQLWRRKVGPGWSSFAVRSNLIYTQEQRGDNEVVSCYYLTTGEPVWRHQDAVRFWESNGGAGPRATPTLCNGRVYTFGATGVLNALDSSNGSLVWSRNAASDTGKKVPGWGFASSPVVVDDVVIIAASGRLAAYDVTTGNRRWLGPDRGGSYSSPHLLMIDGVEQVLLMTGTGAISLAPADGGLLWEHPWAGVPIVQPAQVADGDILISTGGGMGGLGTRRVTVGHGSGKWTATERWTSTGLKPYFNDFVVHKGHAFGFDGSILACIDLADGKRKWKGGRYGNGQLVLLADQDLLLVLSEQGELALVRATLDDFAEVARFPAIAGKTWNHPVLIGDILLVRNGEEMAALRLPSAGH